MCPRAGVEVEEREKNTHDLGVSTDMTSSGSSTCCFAPGTFLSAIQVRIFFPGQHQYTCYCVSLSSCGTRTHFFETFVQQLQPNLMHRH